MNTYFKLNEQLTVDVSVQSNKLEIIGQTNKICAFGHMPRTAAVTLK